MAIGVLQRWMSGCQKLCSALIVERNRKMIMNNYIQIYNNIISDDYCDELREKFDSFPFNQDVEQGPMSFTQINLNSHSEWSEDIKNPVVLFASGVEQLTYCLNQP